jgi:hypothetical protein
VTSIKEGQLGITYESGQATTKTQSSLSQTTYGQKYLQLIRQCLGGVAFRTAVMP